MSLLRYVSHPRVAVDPDVPVPEWSLSEAGRQQAVAMLDQPWLAQVGSIVSSAERKALETAELVAGRLGLDVDVRPSTGEIDRTATGYVTHDRHEALADRLFSEPESSADGWERAIDAQRRILDALGDVLTDTASEHDTLVVGHGGVGTLLWCHLAGLPIDRRHDQPGQGHHWAYDRSMSTAIHPWRPIEVID